MPLFSPQCRYRLYTKPQYYMSAAASLLFGLYKEEEVTGLEEEIQRFTGAAYAVAVPQARVGIYEVIRAAVEPGDEVILSPITIADVINMVVLAGAKPVFCDTEPHTHNLDPDKVEDLITPKTRAVLTTHFYGYVNNMERLADICRGRGIYLFEDAAQAFGARYEGRHAGTLGDAGFYSFDWAKNVTGFYGGMVVTRDKELAAAVRGAVSSYPVFSKKHFYSRVLSNLVKDVATSDLLFPHILSPVFRYGYRREINSIIRQIDVELPLGLKTEMPQWYLSKMTPLTARLVSGKLSEVEKDTLHRIKSAEIYNEGLKDIRDDGLTLPVFTDDGSFAYLYYPLRYADRMKLHRYMIANRRDTAVQHVKNTADLPAFREWSRDCPNARRQANETIMMPTFPRYRHDEVRRNVEVIRSYFDK